MPTSPTNKNLEASVPLNFRIKPATRNLIDRAAELLGKTRTDFMLEASERRAVEVLLDRTVFTVSPEGYAEYVARLDAPVHPNERMKRTMSSKLHGMRRDPYLWTGTTGLSSLVPDFLNWMSNLPVQTLPMKLAPVK